MASKSFIILWGEKLTQGDEGDICYNCMRLERKYILESLLNDIETEASSQMGICESFPDKVTAPWHFDMLQAEISFAKQYITLTRHQASQPCLLSAFRRAKPIQASVKLVIFCLTDAGE